MSPMRLLSCSYTIEEVGMVKDKELRYLLLKKKSLIQCSKSLGQLNAERTCGIGFFREFHFFLLQYNYSIILGIKFPIA